MAHRNESKLLSVGQAIKKAREKKKFSFKQVANQTGFSIDYLKNVEKGKLMPPVAMLLQISKALGIDSRSFLYESKPKIQKSIKRQIDIAENYTFTTLAPNAAHKHLKTFRVSIEGHKEHKGFGYQHEGEEFVFVLSGKVELIVGDHRNTLSKGESLHFNSVIPHKIRNLSEKISELIVAIYTP
jgi:transcriptional regulator with XRE-family HTH domain